MFWTEIEIPQRPLQSSGIHTSQWWPNQTDELPSKQEVAHSTTTTTLAGVGLRPYYTTHSVCLACQWMTS